MEVEKHFIFSCRVDEQPTTATNLHFVILSDKTLQEYLASGRIIIEPLGENAIQPSSVDLRIDSQFRVFKNHSLGIIDVRENLEDLTYQKYLIYPVKGLANNKDRATTNP